MSELSALRQFRHNNDDEFIAGYDKNVIDDILNQLRTELAAMTTRAEEAEKIVEVASRCVNEFDDEDKKTCRICGEEFTSHFTAWEYLDELENTVTEYQKASKEKSNVDS